jgi:hypothetical protein
MNQRQVECLRRVTTWRFDRHSRTLGQAKGVSVEADRNGR